MKGAVGQGALSAIGSALLLAALCGAANAQDNMEPDYEERTRLDQLFDKANENLNSASIYSCNEGPTQRAYKRARSHYHSLSAQAESLLGRHLNITIWTSSCRKRVDHEEFNYRLEKARKYLAQAASMIRRGKSD